MTGLGGLLGLSFGVGLYLLLIGFGPVRARAYVLRIEHYLGAGGRDPRPAIEWFVRTAQRDRIAQRQLRAGTPADPTAHLLSLATASLAGLALGSGVLAFLAATGGVHQPMAAIPLLAICVTSAALLADHRLDAAGRRRGERAVIELPAIAESLAIAVSAGAALPSACELVAAHNAGVLADELRIAVDEVRVGVGVDRALSGMAQRIPVPAVARFIDALRIAMERGTPIVDVLHAQASDARNESRRLLLEQAGRREVAMLVPVVFFVLPAVVVIALYPGFRELTSMV